MMERAKISNDAPRTIMKNCQLNVDSESAVLMIRPNSIRKRIIRIRAKKVDHGPNAKSIIEIVIPHALQLTYDGEFFVFADSGFGDCERIIILATENNIVIMKNNKIWYGDGTFSISPDLFYQVKFY